MIATEKPASGSLFSAQFGSCLLQSPRGLIRCAVIAWDFGGFSSCINCHLFPILRQLLHCHPAISWASIINLHRTPVILSKYLFPLQQPHSQSLLLIESSIGLFWERFWKSRFIMHWSGHLLRFLGGDSLCDFTKELWKSKTPRWPAQLLTSFAAQQDILWRLLHQAQGSLYDLADHVTMARKMFPLCKWCLCSVNWNITSCECTFFSDVWEGFFLDVSLLATFSISISILPISRLQWEHTKGRFASL